MRSLQCSLCTGRGCGKKKFSIGADHFGFLVKLGHRSLWWVRISGTGLMTTLARPGLRTDALVPRPSSFEDDAVALLLRYVLHEGRFCKSPLLYKAGATSSVLHIDPFFITDLWVFLPSVSLMPGPAGIDISCLPSVGIVMNSVFI